MKNSRPIVFVLGPSGVGKSKFGQYLKKERHWLHLEIDRYPNRDDGIDVAHLRDPWDLFYKFKYPADLAMELRERSIVGRYEGCVLTFPSTVVFPVENIVAAEKVSIRLLYLYGSAAHCINSFLNRERRSGRNLEIDHWLTNNGKTYLDMSRPEFEPYRTHVFTHLGVRRPHASVLRDIREKMKRTR